MNTLEDTQKLSPQSPEQLAKARMIIRDWWDEPQRMWELLDELEKEYL